MVAGIMPSTKTLNAIFFYRSPIHTESAVMALWCRSYGVGMEAQDRIRSVPRRFSRFPLLPYCQTRPMDSFATILFKIAVCMRQKLAKRGRVFHLTEYR
uniref:Transposase n=1 Tax=Heterorhabditis bacteriophora TaxID=37862 RepID=A0A1I7W649_HETBA